MKHKYYSGGLNPNLVDTCDYPKCRWLTRGKNRDGGWCEHPENRVPPSEGWPDGFTPSVSSTGGCNLFEVATEVHKMKLLPIACPLNNTEDAINEQMKTASPQEKPFLEKMLEQVGAIWTTLEELEELLGSD